MHRSLARAALWMCAVVPALAAPAWSQTPYFSDKDMMTVGVYYYPEAWPREQWDRDLTNIKSHGFEFVHMADPDRSRLTKYLDSL